MHSNLTPESNGHPALLRAVKKLEQLNPDQFELYFQHRTSTRVEARNQKAESLTRSEDVGLAVRLVKDQRLGFSFTTSLEKSAVDKAIQSALEIATIMPRDEHNGLYSFGSSAYPDVDNFDSRGIAEPIEKKIELALQLETACRQADARITTVRSASVSETILKQHLIDSSGEHIRSQATYFTGAVSCKAETDGDSQMGSDFGFGNHLDLLDVGQIGRQAARLATELLGAQKPPTMQCPAIFRNSVVSSLLEFLSSSFSAEEIDKGRSMLAGKKGERMFSDQVTLIDDGLLPGGYGTSPFDGEGVPSRQVMLVDGGFVQNFLYDNYYARKYETEPTGSTRRGIKAPPSIGISNLYMTKGRKPPEQLMKGISRGILITNLLGVHTANPVTGDFSLGASGILIENGKLSTPVRGFAVAGNILGVFRKITDVGSDLRFFGSVGAPSVRISEIFVGGA